MNPLDLIVFHEKDFTEREKYIMRRILETPDMVLKAGIVNTAEQINVSKSALLRFVQKIGYHGYPEFKYDLSRYLQSGNGKDSNALKYTDIANIYSEVIKKLNETINFDTVSKLAQDIVSTRKLKIFGSHESGLSAIMLSFRLSSIGIDSHALTDESQFPNNSQFSNDQDLSIFFTISSTNERVCEAIDNCMVNKTKCAIITQNTNSSYRKTATHMLYIPSFDNSFGNYFFDSQALNYVVIEMIVNAVSRILNKQ